jgi:hypothetical protein
MTNRIWIGLTIITLVAGYGLHHKVQRVAAPANLQEVFR